MSSVPLFLYPSGLRDAPAETMSRNRGKRSGPGSLAERKPRNLSQPHEEPQFCKFTFLSSFRSPPPRANHHSNHDPSHRRADPFQIQAVQWQSI